MVLWLNTCISYVEEKASPVSFNARGGSRRAGWCAALYMIQVAIFLPKKQWKQIEWMIGALVALLLVSAGGGLSLPSPQARVSVLPSPPLAGLPLAALKGQVTALVPAEKPLQVSI